MPNYLNGKIYVIRSHQTEQVYIGSTVERLSARMSKHRAQYKRYKEGKCGLTTSFKMLDYPDAYIELIELCLMPWLSLCVTVVFHIEWCIRKP